VTDLADQGPTAPGRSRGAVTRWLPGLATLLRYERGWLWPDLAAGIVLTAILVPVGMGYATASGLEPVYGLYATIGGLLGYAVFGPSRVLVLGPDSSLAPIIAATILPLAAGNPAAAAAIAAGLAVLVAVVQIASGLFRVGFVTDLLSSPIRYGYLNGIALTIIVSQLPKLFGFSIDAEGVVDRAAAFGSGVGAGNTNTAALAIGVASLVGILALRAWRPRFPAILVVVVVATIASAVLDVASRWSVSVVGPLPQGFPEPMMPSIPPEHLDTLIPAAVAIAIVSMADTAVLSRTLAKQSGQRVDQNQELIGLGAANVGSAALAGFAISASSSRTPVAATAGARTQLAGVVGALGVLGLLVLVPNALASLPDPVLAGVVIAASLSLVEVAGVRRLLERRPSEFVISMVCLVAVAVVGVVPGIFISVGIALASFVWRAWRPYSAILGRLSGVKGYHDIRRHPDARLIPGLVLLRWDAPLFFANAEMFREAAENAIASSPTPVRWLIVAAEPVTDIDTTAADMLDALDGSLVAAGIELAFAEMKGPAKDRLRRYGLFARVGEHRFYPTVGSAVSAYLAETGVPWVDWEDERSGAGARPERAETGRSDGP
jgi:high affinity sulfate transporter 1